MLPQVLPRETNPSGKSQISGGLQAKLLKMVNDQRLQNNPVARDHSGRVLAAEAGLGLAYEDLSACAFALALELKSGGWLLIPELLHPRLGVCNW